MLRKLSVSAGIFVAFALLTSACKTKPPKQVEAADALTDKGADMQSNADSSGNVKTEAGEKSGEEQMHTKCCLQCQAGLAKDRSGGAANAIPCTDFTDTLDPFCLEHFRGKKTMANECK